MTYLCHHLGGVLAENTLVGSVVHRVEVLLEERGQEARLVTRRVALQSHKRVSDSLLAHLLRRHCGLEMCYKLWLT